MYRVLIVDDEAPARELLKMKIDWASLDCQVTSTAKNGKEALALYNDNEFDLVITDIQMPIMNGLELIEAIKSQNPGQPIIILSCHESFSFARKAIQLGVTDYLIKDSFDASELYNIITDTFKNTHIQNGSRTDDTSLNDELSKSKILNSLIRDTNQLQDIEAIIKEHKLKLHAHQYELFHIEIEVVGQDVANPTTQYLSKNDLVYVHKLFKQSLLEFVEGEVSYDQNNIFYVLYGVTNPHSQIDVKNEAIAIANHMRHAVQEEFEVEVTIGISRPIHQLSSLSEAYQESLNAAKRKIISGYDKTYTSGGSANLDEDQYIKILNVKLNRINDYLEENKFVPIIKEVQDIFLQNLKGFMQYYYLKHTNWTLLSMLIEFCAKNKLSFIEISGSRSPWETIMDIKTVDGMCAWFTLNIGKIQDTLKPEVDNAHSYHVGKCIKYIHNHYEENINLRELADKYDINNAYLSRIFKKETGKSLTDYINDVRIEEAKNMIQNSSKKMYEIAELCGFSSTQRFFMVFKKLVGVSPGDYRKR